VRAFEGAVRAFPSLSPREQARKMVAHTNGQLHELKAATAPRLAPNPESNFDQISSEQARKMVAHTNEQLHELKVARNSNVIPLGLLQVLPIFRYGGYGS